MPDATLTAPAKPRAKKIGFGDFYATPTGLKVGTKGKVRPASEVLGDLPKGAARAVRKACRTHGFPRHAAAPRRAS